MKIAYVVSQFPSLTETFIAREIQQVARLGHEVIVCILRPQPANSGPQGLDVPEVRQIRVCLDLVSQFAAQFRALTSCPTSYFRAWGEVLSASLRKPARAMHLIYDLVAAVWLSHQLQGKGVQYIHGHFLHNEVISAMWLARLLAIPYGVTAHVASIRHSRWLIARVVSEADLLVGDTIQTLDIFRMLSGREALLLRNGLDLSQFPLFNKNESFDQLKNPLILSVGSLLHPKGFHILIAACALLHEQGVKFRCRIIGEGVERTNLEALINHHRLDTCIELPGALSFDALERQYSEASLLVMPSIPSPTGSDGLPTVLIESMALGIPVVASNHAGIPDLIRPFKTGLLFQPGNAAELAASITKMLCNPELRQKMLKNGRRMIEEEYNLERNVCRLLDLALEASS